MRHTTRLPGGVLILALGLAGCGGGDISPVLMTPSPLPREAPVSWPPGTLTGVSLSGFVYELTPEGRTPIAGAVVYCEPCGLETHTFATADGNGYYHFTGDLAAGGGIWVTPGVPTPIAVGYYNKDFEDPPELPVMSRGPGWRQVLIAGDTHFDIELVRRAAPTP